MHCGAGMLEPCKFYGKLCQMREHMQGAMEILNGCGVAEVPAAPESDACESLAGGMQAMSAGETASEVLSPSTVKQDQHEEAAGNVGNIPSLN